MNLNVAEKVCAYVPQHAKGGTCVVLGLWCIIFKISHLLKAGYSEISHCVLRDLFHHRCGDMMIRGMSG